MKVTSQACRSCRLCLGRAQPRAEAGLMMHITASRERAATRLCAHQRRKTGGAGRWTAVMQLSPASRLERMARRQQELCLQPGLLRRRLIEDRGIDARVIQSEVAIQHMA